MNPSISRLLSSGHAMLLLALITTSCGLNKEVESVQIDRGKVVKESKDAATETIQSAAPNNDEESGYR